MSDQPAPDTAAPATPDEPKVDAHADKPHAHAPEHASERPAEAVPAGAAEAEASVEQVTAPDPDHAPQPAPDARAPVEAAASIAALTEEPAPVEPPAAAETHAPQPEPASEALVPTHEPAPVTEEAKPEPPAEEPKPKPKRAKAAKTPKAAPTAPEPATPTASVAPAAEPTAPASDTKKKWYAIKVQSGREDTIKSAILRKVAIEGLEEFVGRIEIPVEEEIVKKSVRVKDKKTGEYTTQEKKVTKKKKKFHGYIFAELEFNDRILYLIRETSGVGDFLNMRNKKGEQPMPEPMPDHEVQAMLTGERQRDPLKAKKVKLDFEKGDKVRIRDGSFANSEGEVKAIAEAKDPNEAPKVTVVLTFWGRPLDVELDASQVEKL